jgi:hypothetical protein
MSAIFDNVDFATTRRKNKVLDSRHTRNIFGAQGPGAETHVEAAPNGMTAFKNAAVACTGVLGYANSITNLAQERPTTESTLVHSIAPGKLGTDAALHVAASMKFSPCDTPPSLKIDLIWTACVGCSLVPLFAAVYAVVVAPSFSTGMLAVPYECKLFYFGLFCALPGMTVHIFCLSLIFHQLCRSGVVLSMLSTFLMIVAIEHACMTMPLTSSDYPFYLMATSVYCGLVAQAFFISILYYESRQKQCYIGMLGVAFVLVTLSVLSIALSMLNSETPHTKPTALVRIIPLSLAIVIYAFSTYWTLFPVRVVCHNM